MCASVSQAQEENVTEAKTTNSTGQLSVKTVAVSYLAWTEFVDLKNGNLEDNAYANFYGMALTLEKENYSRRWGTAAEASALFGQANAGGSQQLITYQTNYRSWYGLEASYRLAYRHTAQVSFSIGPFGLFRQVTWPGGDNNIDVKSGSQTNGGLLADLRYRLTRQLEVRQMIGTMAFKANTIWSLGIGYKF